MSLSFPLAAVKVPEDILMEILARLPASSLLRFKCVSKLWSSLISSRYFTNLFFKFSSRRQERRLFAHYNGCLLFSTSLCNLDSTPTLNLDLTFPCNNTNVNDRLELVNGVRGLMCFRNRKEREIQIINYTTRQVLRFPLVESNLFLESDDYDVWNYFGYDPLNDEYKVLNINYSCGYNEEEVRSETQVFVLGEGASWRDTKSLTFSPPPHYPRDDREISINGVLYYAAESYEERIVLMTFDFSSEEFNLVEFPMEYHTKLDKEYRKVVELIHYQYHVAVFFDDSRLNTECILHLWVLEDTGNSKWSHKVLGLPCHQIREILKPEDWDYLRIRGTGLKGEVTLNGRYVNRDNKGTYNFDDDEICKGTYLFYDLENNRITKGFVIEFPREFGIRLMRTDIWEDVESIMYLEV